MHRFLEYKMLNRSVVIECLGNIYLVKTDKKVFFNLGLIVSF